MLIDLVTKVAPALRSSSWTRRHTFPETLSFVDDVRERYGLNLTVTKPGPEAAAYPCGTEQCCQFRKVEPLRRAIAGKRAWLTSLKRSDGPDPRRCADRQLGRRVRAGEGQPAGNLDRGRHHVVPGRPRATGAPARLPGLPLHRVCADDAPGGRRGGRTRRALGRCRQVRVRPARLVPRDLDNPYGMEFRGRRDRGLKFIRPYRNIGELNSVEQLKLSRHPFEVAQAVIDTYSKQGADSITKVPGEQERLKWVGHVPAAPRRRCLHDADQGARRGDDGGPGPRDRCGGRRLCRGPRRQPRVREPLRRPHDQAGHSAALDPHRRRARGFGSVSGMSG